MSPKIYVSVRKILEKNRKKTENFPKGNFVPENHLEQATYRFGEFELNSIERILLRNGRRVSLRPRALDLLLALVEGEGHLLTKEALLNSVWADAVVEEGNLNRTISALRKALGEEKGENRFIETVPKVGYRFVADVQLINGNGSNSLIAINGRGLSPAVSKNPISYRWPLWLGAFVLLFGSLIGSYLLVSKPALNEGKPAASDVVTRLTNNQFDEDQAVWTPEGQIRFVRFETNAKAESYVMNADGTGEQRANATIKNLRTGSWSPDGKKVIFNKEGESPNTVYLADADGANELKLPFNAGPCDWSADGTKVVYSNNLPSSNNSEIFVYDVKSSKSVNVSNSAAFDANPSFSPDGKQIVFNSDREAGLLSIYLMNSDGTNVRRLTDHPAGEVFPVFSPDGTQILFNSKRENEKIGIYLINVNENASPVKVSDTTYNAETRQHPWSADGAKIVFTSDKDGDRSNIYTMNVEPFKPRSILSIENVDAQSPSISPDGKKIAFQAKMEDKSGELRVSDLETRRSQTLAKTENADLSPAWSPNGALIAFNCKIAGNTEICTVKTDGSDLQNLTNDPSLDGNPVWSPDGKELVFSSNRDGDVNRLQLFRMDSNGANQRRITKKHGYEMTPAWSPEGTKIAFAGDRADGSSRALDIFLLDLNDPSSERILAIRRFHDTLPTFSPDGNRIAFVSQADGNSEIYLMNADGSGLLRLTRNPAEDTTPQFSKDGKKVLFSSNREGRYAIFEVLLN